MTSIKKSAQKRQQLKIDPATIGEGVPMLSSSGQAMAVGDLLYVPRVQAPYGEKIKVSVESHRVIQVNYQRRTVRLRCAEGCESTLEYGRESCFRDKYFHTIEGARAELAFQLWEKRHKAEAAIQEKKTYIADLRALLKSTTKTNPKKVPPAVNSPV